MVYRELPCSQCEAAGQTRCPRCGATLCREHRVRSRRRCPRCEAEFRQRVERMAEALGQRYQSSVEQEPEGAMGAGLFYPASFGMRWLLLRLRFLRERGVCRG